MFISFATETIHWTNRAKLIAFAVELRKRFDNIFHVQRKSPLKRVDYELAPVATAAQDLDGGLQR